MRYLTRNRRSNGLNLESLILTQEAYDKLVWFRDQKDTEVGAMAITDENDPMLVRNFVFLPQECTSVTTEFDHDKQCDWMEDQAEAGLTPDTYARIWAHTHPGESASPSSTDWETFGETMGQMPWGVMLILGTSNEFACVFRVKDQMINIPVEVIAKGIPDAWKEELKNIGQRSYNQSSHQTEWEWGGTGQGYTKFVRKLRIPDWDEPKSYSSFVVYKKAALELTGMEYARINQWNPSIEEVMTTGPCKIMGLIIQMYRNVSDGADEMRVKHVIDKMSALFTDNDDCITDYDTENAQYSDPVALLHQARESGDKLKNYVKAVDPEVSQYLWYDTKKKSIYLKDYEKTVPGLLASDDELTREEALNSCITSALYYDDYCKLIDDGCREFIQQFIEQQVEYSQCQNDHEKTVI